MKSEKSLFHSHSYFRAGYTKFYFAHLLYDTLIWAKRLVTEYEWWSFWCEIRFYGAVMWIGWFGSLLCCRLREYCIACVKCLSSLVGLFPLASGHSFNSTNLEIGHNLYLPIISRYFFLMSKVLNFDLVSAKIVKIQDFLFNMPCHLWNQTTLPPYHFLAS